MSLQVGFSAHSKELKSAYEQVIDVNSAVNWLIYTYDKGTNDLKVQATGEDGLEELSEEFIDGRIQYALARVKDPNTELPKLVFIAWVRKKNTWLVYVSLVFPFLLTEVFTDYSVVLACPNRAKDFSTRT